MNTYTSTLTPGWALSLATPPQGFATTRIGRAGLDTQSTPLTWWPDGSVRMALLASRVTVAGRYTLVADPPPLVLPPMVPVWPAASVTFSDSGVTYRALLTLANITASTDIWHTGPLAEERAVVVVPVDPANKPHPLVQVVYDVCAFADGSSRLDVSITNARDSVDARAVTLAGLTILIGSTTIWARDLLLWQGQCPSWSGSTGGYLASRVHPDSQMFYDAGLIEPIHPSVENPTGVRQDAAWEPGNFGTMSYSQSAPGGRGELGPYTSMTASYLVHHGDDQQDRMLADGRLAGSWCALINQADGLTPIHLSDTPHFQYASVRGEKAYYQLNGPHLPSLAFVPFLVTGQRVYLRHVQGWARTAVIDTWDGDANTKSYCSDIDYDYSRHTGGDICFLGSSYFGEPRGIGWVLRAVVDAAVCTPSRDHAAKTYLETVVSQNVARFDAYAVLPHNGGFFNAPGQETDPGGGDGQYGGVHVGYGSISFWMWAYAWFGLRHAVSCGFASNLAMIRRIAGSLLSYFVSAPEKDWPLIASFYYPRVTIHPYLGPHTPLNTWAEVYAANYTGALDSHDMQPPGTPGPPYYFCEYYWLIAEAARLGLPGADRVLAWLGPQALGQFPGRPGYALPVGVTGLVVTPPGPPIDPPPVDPLPGPITRVLKSLLTATLDQVDDPKPFELLTPVKGDAPPPPPPPPPPPTPGLLPHIRPSYKETPQPRAVGEEFPLTAIAYNVGRGQATGVVLDTGLDAALEVLTQDGGASFDPSSGEWHVGTIDSGVQKELAMKVKVKP